jgi:putative DNA primase/helicase
LLCQVLTEETPSIRMLGFSRNVNVSPNMTIFATGNNLRFVDDLADRSLLGTLDAKTEYPGQRKFGSDVIAETRAYRSELVVAVLTILRAWHLAYAAGERVTGIEPFGGFEDWSHRVREPLIWRGRSLQHAQEAA